jgi:hypothetical protein
MARRRVRRGCRLKRSKWLLISFPTLRSARNCSILPGVPSDHRLTTQYKPTRALPRRHDWNPGSRRFENEDTIQARIIHYANPIRPSTRCYTTMRAPNIRSSDPTPNPRPVSTPAAILRTSHHHSSYLLPKNIHKGPFCIYHLPSSY